MQTSTSKTLLTALIAALAATMLALGGAALAESGPGKGGGSSDDTVQSGDDDGTPDQGRGDAPGTPGADGNGDDDGDRDDHGDDRQRTIGTISAIDGRRVTVNPRAGDPLTATTDRRTRVRCDDDRDDHGGEADDNRSDDRRGHSSRRGRGRGRGHARGKCRLADLAVGDRVRKADLRLTASGARWKKIDVRDED